jgi:hypothetical protein
MRLAGPTLGIVLAAALGACAHQTSAQGGAQAPEEGQASAASAAGCPLAQLQGVHAAVTDTPDGVAITFAAPKGEVDALRGNVHAMADTNDKRGDAFAACACAAPRGALGAAESMPEQGGGGAAAQAEHATKERPLADAKVTETPTGAVLKLSAKEKSQVGALRSFTRENVRELRKNCFANAPSPSPKE